MIWPTIVAGEIMVKRGGSVNPAKFSEEIFDLLSIHAFDQGEVEVLPGSEIGSSKSCVQEKDVLLSKIIPHVRRCWVVPQGSGRRQIGSGEWIIFRSDKFDPNFLKHYLTSNGFHKQFMNTVAGVGGSLVRARPAAVEKIEIPLPPLKEQKRIATILDKADAIRRKRQKAIDLTEQLLRSVFLDMFGDPVTNPKKFQIRCLKEFYINSKDGTKCGPFGSALKKYEYVSSGVPVWNMDNISKESKFSPPAKLWIDEQKYKQLETYNTINGDIIISRAGTVGKMCVLKSGYKHSIISTNLIRLRLNKNLSPIYFVSLMNYCKGRVGRLKTGPDGAFTHMNTGVLDKLNFPYPPIELQNKYEQIFEKFNSKLRQQSDGLGLIDALFASLTQQAFHGDLAKQTEAA